MYAIISETDYYGPSTRIEVVAFAATLALANNHVAALEAASTAEHGCQVLANGQASGTTWRAMRVRPDQCATGWSGQPMYRGRYIPTKAALSQRDIITA